MSRQIKAAVIRAGSKIPTYTTVSLPPAAEGEVTVKVLATGFSHLVKGRAAGSHYSAVKDDSGADTHVGVDGVGYVDDKLVYFTTFTPKGGSYAQYVNTPKTQIFPFPAGITDKDAIARVASLANGVMSSYLPLGGRIPTLKKNPKIVILGVTGTSGQLAIQISKNIFNASSVIGIARSADKLKALKESQPLLDHVVSFDDNDDEIIKSGLFADADVVLDYLWGKPSARYVDVLLKSKKVSHDLLSWVQIGQIAGDATLALPAGYLRSANFQVLGSGFGPLSPEKLAELLGKTADVLAEGKVNAPYAAVPIQDIETTWDAEWDAQTRKYFVFDHE